MALPIDPSSREEILARRRAAEEEALLREVDEAVRQDDMLDFGQRYGRLIAVLVGVIILGFGGYLYWQNRQDAARASESEMIVAALDQAQANNLAAAATAAQPLLDNGNPGPRGSAQLLAAGAAQGQGDSAKAARLLDALANDAKAPRPIRDLARIRLVATKFDTMDKTQVISQLGPLAHPGSPWFGSAGELVAMAYLEQGKKAEAGKIFGNLATDASVPDPNPFARPPDGRGPRSGRHSRRGQVHATATATRAGWQWRSCGRAARS